MSDLERIVAGLKRPDAYPHPVDRVEHIETHISHLLLAGDFAYKLKKPLDLGFLDFSTPERRLACCREELRLNRRLAPDLYLGLVGVRGTPDAPRIGPPALPADGGATAPPVAEPDPQRASASAPRSVPEAAESPSGPLLEHAVRMHRFPQSALLTRAPLTPEIVDRLGERLADFHAAIPVAPPESPYGTPEAVLAPMLENFRQVRTRVTDPERAGRLDELEVWTRARWEVLTPVLLARREEGRVRECHGDMHRGNIACVAGEPLIFDALEFSAGLRWIDTASELAFLLMDLEEAGELAAARRLLNRYLERSGDFGALRVLDFYKVYRAMVRAKVLAIRLAQPHLPAGDKESARCDCARYLSLAADYTRGRRPRLLIACGLSGSGKSRLALRLRECLPLVHLRSDLERKRLFGVHPQARTGTHPESGIYFPQATEWTYQRLARLAQETLAAGYDALVDATFLTCERRTRFRTLARACGASFAILALDAPLPLLRERVIRRLAEGGDASDAGLEVLECQRAKRESLSPAEEPFAIRIDTTEVPPLAPILARLAAVTGQPIAEPPAREGN